MNHTYTRGLKVPRFRVVEGMRPFFAQTIKRLEVSYTSKVHFHMSRSRRWTRKSNNRNKAHAASNSKMAEEPNYTAWSHQSLVERVTQLELEFKNKNQRSVTNSPQKNTLMKEQFNRSSRP
jgi:hypothetical protein